MHVGVAFSMSMHPRIAISPKSLNAYTYSVFLCGALLEWISVVFLNSFNYFRAIAIIIIVAGHAFDVLDISFDTPLERILYNLIKGGTVLFVFISGFLFHHIFYQRYQYRKFMLSKLKKVLLPYTLFAVVLIMPQVISQNAAFEFFEPVGAGFMNTYIVPAFKYYITGRFLGPFWYVPFVMLVFLMSPLHIAFINLRLKQQLLVTFLLTVVSLFLHRPIHNILILQAVVYFTPVYLVGILCSENRDLLYQRLKNKEIYLLLAAIALAAFESVLGERGIYFKEPFLYGGIDIMLLQKLVLCLFFMVWLHRFEQVNLKLLDVIAATSFAIYFIHMFPLLTMGKLQALLLQLSMGFPWILFLVSTIATVLFSVGLAITVRKLVPDKSRYIIGY